ncbi:MAG: OB-fold nucleic acid binding domain-containing protein [Candidatus Aenigmarchaeota archaeon]|nr:OB-fold nucleic acid binding domain-containing protein [Candidatus Aenigmarchaeota archaeon]
MVSDKTLQQIALVTTLIGVALLFILSLFMEPTAMRIQEITEQDVGKTVVVTGTITTLDRSKNTFLTLTDDQMNLAVAIFEKTGQTMPELENITQGDSVEITGKIVLYKGEIELLASHLKTFKPSKEA